MEENNQLTNDTYKKIKENEEITENQRMDCLLKRLDKISNSLSWIAAYYIIKIIISFISILIFLYSKIKGINIINNNLSQ